MNSNEHIKYSDNFLRDYYWYLSVASILTFSGTDKFISKKGHELIIHSYSGQSAKYCFYKYDTNGVIVPTNEPDKLKQLYTTKAAVNLQIKEYAIDRYSGLLTKFELEDICNELKAPGWFIKAVENQKQSMYSANGPYKLI